MKKIWPAMLIIALVLSFTACKSNKEEDTTITKEAALSMIKSEYGESDSQTGFAYDWSTDEEEEIVEIEGIEYFNFTMTFQQTETDASGAVVDTFSTYKTNVLVSTDGKSIVEALMNTDTKKWEIQE